MHWMWQALPAHCVILAALISGPARSSSNAPKAHNARAGLRTRRAANVLMIAMLLTIAGPMGVQAQGAADIDALNKQSVKLYGQGKYAEATPIAEQALTLAERALGREHPDTLKSVYNLASLYLAQGRYGEAEALYRRALEAQERVLGKEHPQTLLSVNNLAALYYAQGRYGEAEPLYRRALEAQERVLGKEHLATLTSVNNLALLYQAQTRYSEAEPLFKRALEASERALGREHRFTLLDYGSIHILGTGGAHGIERLDRIASPVSLRNAIDAR